MDSICSLERRRPWQRAPGIPRGRRPLDREYDSSYTTLVKTAISIPDQVFQQAERAAKRLGLSRSEFFTLAVKAYLVPRLDASIKASYDAAFGEAGDDDTEDLRRRATRKALLAVEWEDE